MLCLWLPFDAYALQKSLTIITDHQKQAHYQNLISSIQLYADRLTPIPEIEIIHSSNSALIKNAIANKKTCIVSMGIQAFNIVSNMNDGPSCSLSLLISKSQFHAAPKNFQKTSSAIYINQPLQRIIRALQLTLKHAEKASIVLSDEWPGELNLVQTKIDLHIKYLPADASIIQAFRQVSKDTDFVIALPDSNIYNKSNIKNILLTTYKAKVPLIGYSEALSRAGALISIYTPSKQLGKQAIEWFSQGQNRTAAEPKYFQVKLNHKVAKSLGVSLKNQTLFSRETWVDDNE